MTDFLSGALAGDAARRLGVKAWHGARLSHEACFAAFRPSPPPTPTPLWWHGCPTPKQSKRGASPFQRQRGEEREHANTAPSEQRKPSSLDLQHTTDSTAH